MRTCRRLRALVILLGTVLAVRAQATNELRISARGEPSGSNPLDVRDEFADLVRYFTGGVLIRLNRSTQMVEPALATSWKISPDGRKITLDLRKGVRFSDGSPLDSADVVHTFRLLMAPDLHSSAADSFRLGGVPPSVEATGPLSVSILFPAPVPGMARLFDEVAIQSSRAKPGSSPGLGPYVLTEHKRGAYLLFDANPNYWKRGESGEPLPKIRRIRMFVQSNRELEALAFRRAELDLISSIDARTFEELSAALPKQVFDTGPSLDREFLWFNQTGKGKIPDYKRQWFGSREFRKAISLAINRADISRVAYRGRAIPASGPYPPGNRMFFNSALKPHPFDVQQARQMLTRAGFRNDGSGLRDSSGNPVSFTLLTNAGNRARSQTAALIQQDLKALGISVNIVVLDFSALLERILKTYDYEACVFGTVGVSVDPATDMDIWLSSGASHIWNPGQSAPSTDWERQIDGLMQKQSAAVSDKDRKSAFDRVQQILYEQEPMLYLVHPNALAAASPVVKGVSPVLLRPQLLWNIESLELMRPK